MTAARRARGEAGMSLVELLVAMVIGSMLAAGVAAVFIGTLRSVQTVNVKTSSAADIRVGLDAMGRSLRVATPVNDLDAVQDASANGIRFYALLNRQGVSATLWQVEYAWVSATGCVNQILRQATATTTAVTLGTPSTTCLLRTTVPPEFGYFSDGAADATQYPAPVAAADRGSIHSIGLKLTGSTKAGVSGVPSYVRVTLVNVLAAEGGS